MNRYEPQSTDLSSTQRWQLYTWPHRMATLL